MKKLLLQIWEFIHETGILFFLVAFIKPNIFILPLFYHCFIIGFLSGLSTVLVLLLFSPISLIYFFAGILDYFFHQNTGKTPS
jgi:hypothetical protein